MVVVAAQERMSTRNIVLVYIPAPPLKPRRSYGHLDGQPDRLKD